MNVERGGDNPHELWSADCLEIRRYDTSHGRCSNPALTTQVVYHRSGEAPKTVEVALGLLARKEIDTLEYSVTTVYHSVWALSSNESAHGLQYATTSNRLGNSRLGILYLER